MKALTIFIVLIAMLSKSAYAHNDGVFIGKVPDEQRHRFQKGTVVEFYSYACIYCYRADNEIEQAISDLGPGYSLLRIPVAIRDRGMTYNSALVAVVMEKLSLEKHHSYIFQIIHAPLPWEATRFNRLAEEADVAELLEELGVSEKTIEKELAIAKEQVIKNNRMAADFEAYATPTIVVNGKYLIMGLRNAFDGAQKLRADIVTAAREAEAPPSND